ncbi:type IV toxin-antitoxin system AbiEi family antitoxin domain-containing protein [Lactobacillus kefiranofaciens]|uniref:Type IV toxin-antitoxin system AbiEi family antitoxin domain-containing protein n=1 Tax=Lactobacillus kefiranofaciens TaxID=267818 RepID=A0AAX3UDJ1_9LACO|nr:type IV toxin-antitoxin system AbiEi family antitoxin domain-containing protein [Lactobacillus kefiranofaciens]AEG41631.1 Hypothetical protein WANG_p1028 [Lactobacillus kefiranofaciens subsp. kefiranofaciens]WGO85761.1 type IV toxin-antitoxin system AbiEi family antitoxin domain-containing protein [Lactobacillus kefiranofaciens]WQH36918.1 type IV toxin-antitoxin system AbiEi family antitoxin domain-containing protein [Lactobacillus kefiranofaciens]
MNQQVLIKKLAAEHNGTLTHNQLVNNNISSYNINLALKSGLLERTRSGIYQKSNTTEDIFYSLQQKYKRGVYSLETALYLWDLSDQYPFSLDMTFPRGYNHANLDLDINAHYQIKTLQDIRITETKSFNGNTIRVYSPERTLAEVLRTINMVDVEIVTNAYKTWAKRNEKNINALMDFAEKFKVMDKANSYLEVLL